MPNSVRGFLQPYLHLWHLLISWRLQVLSSRRLRRLLQTIADYNAIFDSDFFVNTNLLQQASPSSLFHQKYNLPHSATGTRSDTKQQIQPESSTAYRSKTYSSAVPHVP